MADLAGGINHLAKLVDGATTDLGQMLASLAQGDLAGRIHNQYEEALGELKDNANRTADQLGDIVAQIQSATSNVGSAAAEISSGTSDLSQRAEQAAASASNVLIIWSIFMVANRYLKRVGRRSDICRHCRTRASKMKRFQPKGPNTRSNRYLLTLQYASSPRSLISGPSRHPLDRPHLKRMLGCRRATPRPPALLVAPLMPPTS